MKPQTKRHCGQPSLRASVMFLTALFLFLSTARAGSNSGADFLKIPVGAEAAGLGQAYTALSHDLNALNWNPAGIARTTTRGTRPTAGISLSHQDQFSENNLDHIGVIVPSGNGRNSWGLDLIRLSYTEQDYRGEDGAANGTFRPSDMALGAAYARNFGTFQMGTQLKFIRQELADSQANGFAMDLGFLSATPIPKLSMGLSARNIGPSMKFQNDSYSLPLTYSLGTAFHVSNPLTLALDVHYKPHQHQTVLALGTQVFATQSLVFRAGYLAKLAEAVTNNQQSETNRNNFAGVSGLAGGLGIQFRQFNIDYSITPFGELGNTQMLTLSTWFGDNRKVEEPTPAAQPEPKKENNIMKLPDNDDNWWGDLK